MIKHIVLFKIKQETSEKLLSSFISGIKTLKSITGVVDLTIGPTFTYERCRGYTHALVVSLDSRDALQEYARNDHHLKVIQDNILPILEKDGLLAIDIEE